MTLYFKKINSIIGAKVMRYLLLSIVTGAVWFFIEAGFISVLQHFFLAIKLIGPEQAIVSFIPSTTPFEASALLVLFGILRALATVAKSYVSTLSLQSFINRQRQMMLENSLRSANQINTNEVTALFTETMTQAGGIVQQVSNLFVTGVSSTLFLAYGFYLAPTEMIIASLLLTLLFFPYKFTSSNIKNSGSGLATEWNLSLKILLQGIKNNFFLQAYKLVDEEINKGKQSLENYFIHQKNYSLSSSILSTIPLSIGVFIIAVVSFISVTYMGTKSFVLISFIYIFIRFSQTLSEAFATTSQIRFYVPGFLRLMKWHESLIHRNEVPVSNVKQSKIEQLEISNVSFRYFPGFEILKNINFKVNKGEILLIKGESGSGKSTLLAIILGILNPNLGKVTFNSIEVPLDTSQLGYVGPDPFLIPGTIKENLILGNPLVVSDDSIWNMLRFCQLENVLNKLEGGLDHYLTEATPLSTGQKQRMSLARALLRNPSILILDEATANLDEETESFIIMELLKISPGILCLVISHKDSFDQIATQKMILTRNN